MDRKFLLCFHDFSVWNYQTVMPVLEELKNLAGSPFSVLVIPDVEGARENDVAGFKSALDQLQSEGFELALHGFKHRAEFSQGRNYLGLVAMNQTGGEAEFAGLSQFESARLLEEGLAAWKTLVNESPVAFVPPTWWSNDFLPKQVRSAGMLYEDRFSLTTARGTRYASMVTSFAGIPDVAINPMFEIGKLMLRVPFGVPRIALHPVDFPRLSGKVHDLIRLALGNQRKLVRYKDL